MKRISKLFVFSVTIFICFSLNVQAKDGWIQDGDVWYYYQNGSKVKNKCKEIYYGAIGRNAWFCFDEQGIMLSNTEETFNGKTYSFDENGVRSESYYDKNGVLIDSSKSGWVQMDDVWYYYKSGKPVTGLKTLEYSGGSGKFYFNDDGQMEVGFMTIEIKGKELDVYFDEEVGYMVTNTTRQIDGETYRFYKDGSYEEATGETLSDDEEDDYIDEDEDELIDEDDTDYDFDDDTDDIISSGGNSSGGSSSNGGKPTESTYKYNSKIKKNSCESVNNVIDFLMALLDGIHIFIPIILILMGSIDLTKSVLSSDEKMMKMATSSFIKRCLAAVIVFFVPVIVELLFSLPGLPSIKSSVCSIIRHYFISF